MGACRDMPRLRVLTICLGLLISLVGVPASALSLSPSTDELYGRVGDPGVVQINGRSLSVRVLLAISEGSWVRYLGFWDVTNSSSIWGDIKPLNAGGGEVTIRDL